mmetsp:Transcript_24558/g.84761  ORF Transcript_24558/g.84761 Transcript_24558/m.84761 type:complete len:153 (+) Transcript_24558:482-940(+)
MQTDQDRGANERKANEWQTSSCHRDSRKAQPKDAKIGPRQLSQDLMKSQESFVKSGLPHFGNRFDKILNSRLGAISARLWFGLLDLWDLCYWPFGNLVAVKRGLERRLARRPFRAVGKTVPLLQTSGNEWTMFGFVQDRGVLPARLLLKRVF